MFTKAVLPQCLLPEEQTADLGGGTGVLSKKLPKRFGKFVPPVAPHYIENQCLTMGNFLECKFHEILTAFTTIFSEYKTVPGI